MWSHVVVQHFAHHQQVLGPTQGIGADKDGRSTQSECEPVAWFVLEPSNPQMGGFFASATILVFAP